MRNAFIHELVSLARQHHQIALIVGDLGYSVIEPFADEFPDRFINAGVAEQNMTGLAAGMASEGYHVFTYSIGNFPTYRCAEQIRNDVAYHNLAVTAVAVGGGVAYGSLGYSHHAIQDYALMRAFPNMLIASPGDPMEVRSCMRYLVENPGPSYLRLGKAGEPNFHKKLPTIFPGKWTSVNKGDDSEVFLTTGAGLQVAMDWLNEAQYRNRSVFSMPLWSMNDKKKQAAQLIKCSHIITVEDHLIDGGFGSWLLEAAIGSEIPPTIIQPFAVSEIVCGTVASQATLHKLGGLSR